MCSGCRRRSTRAADAVGVQTGQSTLPFVRHPVSVLHRHVAYRFDHLRPGGRWWQPERAAMANQWECGSPSFHDVHPAAMATPGVSMREKKGHCVPSQNGRGHPHSTSSRWARINALSFSPHASHGVSLSAPLSSNTIDRPRASTVSQKLPSPESLSCPPIDCAPMTAGSRFPLGLPSIICPPIKPSFLCWFFHAHHVGNTPVSKL